MAKLETIRLNAGAMRIKEGKSAETWKGTAYYEGFDIGVYAKIEPVPELIADIVAAIAGRASGLNIPTPYLIVIDKSNLPYSEAWKITTAEAVVGFASRDADAISFKQWLNKNSAAAAKALMEWRGYRDAVMFDEWIANADRNPGNMLYDGDVHLIDHGHALTGPGWPLWPIDPETMTRNDLLNFKSETLSEHERYQWIKHCNTMAKRFRDNTPFAELDELLASDFKNIQNSDSIVPFLQERIEKLVGLLCKKLNISQVF